MGKESVKRTQPSLMMLPARLSELLLLKISSAPRVAATLIVRQLPSLAYSAFLAAALPARSDPES
jgi:hypothetical protein